MKTKGACYIYKMQSSYIFYNHEDQISIHQMDPGFWVARRFSDPRNNIATLQNWEDNPLKASPESWNCREGQREFWNKVLREWKLSVMLYTHGEPPEGPIFNVDNLIDSS